MGKDLLALGSYSSRGWPGGLFAVVADSVAKIAAQAGEPAGFVGGLGDEAVADCCCLFSLETFLTKCTRIHFQNSSLKEFWNGRPLNRRLI